MKKMNKHWLEQLSEKYNMTLYQLSKIAGIDKSTLYKNIQRHTTIENTTLGTLEGIAKGLGITLQDLLKEIRQYK